MKYIDAETLIALIDTELEDLGMSGSVWVGRSVLQELKNDIITSLQQEQSEDLSAKHKNLRFEAEVRDFLFFRHLRLQPELFEKFEKSIENYQFNRVKIIDADNQIEVKKAISKSQIVVWNDLIDTKIADNVELLKMLSYLTKHKKIMSVLLGEKLSKLARYKENYTLCEPDDGAFVDYLSGKVLPGIEILHRLSKYTKKMENY